LDQSKTIQQSFEAEPYTHPLEQGKSIDTNALIKGLKPTPWPSEQRKTIQQRF
jgi:hypothetical protein